MQGATTAEQMPPVDSSQKALDFVHRLLAAANAEQPDLSGLLVELASGSNDPEQARWAAQLDHVIRQQRLEAAARLVRRVAHDFGNVLTGILGFSELALGQPLAADSPVQAYLSEIYRSAQNGAQYTNQLRLFARRHSSSPRPCAVPAVLADEEKRLRSLAGVEMNLRFDLTADLPAVVMDGEQLRQVLAVLLDNARDALGGSGSIIVSARLVQLTAEEGRALFGEVRPGAHVEITIADSGRGLTPQAERELFAEPFFSTKPRKGGFGLAIAYGLLAAHRGGIALARRSEGGTVARIVVPAAEVPVPAAMPAPTPMPQEARGNKVLVVDDDPMILQFVTTTLQRAGYRVLAVSDAEEALRSYTSAADDPFHLVLSDVYMPQINGVDLAKRLLAHDGTVRVLFMTGQPSAEFPHDAFAPGQFELLSKPFRPEGLVRAVRAALDRPAPQPPAAQAGT